jgi:hypothetical protein
MNAKLRVPLGQRLFNVTQKGRPRVGGHIELCAQLTEWTSAWREIAMDKLVKQGKTLLSERLIAGDRDRPVGVGLAQCAARES